MAADKKKVKLKVTSGGKKAIRPKDDPTAAARGLIKKLYSDPIPERADGLDRIYSKEVLEGYDAFMERFGIEDPNVAIREFHRRYADIINNPTRREILKALMDGDRTFDELHEITGIDQDELKHQIVMLDFCVDELKRGDEIYYHLSKIGRIIENF
ncbi:hypothetical protein DRN98_01395 [Methanosarcinales archaeon]|uniref:Bacterial regulatory protein, ArsR domain protein n=1 Tax=Candidatus Syntropharchaeum caldarium TaxID=1838285 RepID=A0A1F2P8L5_9EURY|nr:MAG: Bacterial regulatory protein, ArsR domain protein [Candidatus Syntrophoarchaeum caldarius]RLG35391.1 MAG: hypothetical protein DRN98_01395 [Methanosarcinales archaeon]